MVFVRLLAMSHGCLVAISHLSSLDSLVVTGVTVEDDWLTLALLLPLSLSSRFDPLRIIYTKRGEWDTSKWISHRFDGVVVTSPRLWITTDDASIDSKWETLQPTELKAPFFYFLTIGVLLFVCWMKSLGWYEERCIPQVLPHDIKQETYKRNSSKPRTPISWKFCHIFYLLLGIISFKTNSSD